MKKLIVSFCLGFLVAIAMLFFVGKGNLQTALLIASVVITGIICLTALYGAFVRLLVDKVSHFWLVPFIAGGSSLVLTFIFTYLVYRQAHKMVFIVCACIFALFFVTVIIYHLFQYFKADVMKFIDRMKELSFRQ